MKTKLLLFLAALAILAVGCIRTQNGKRTAAVPLVKDKIEGRYERPATQVFEAAKEVIKANGTLSSDGTLHSGTNVGGILVLEGRVNKRTVWVSVEQVDAKVSAIIVQARTKGGGKDIELCHQLEKEVAVKLAVSR